MLRAQEQGTAQNNDIEMTDGTRFTLMRARQRLSSFRSRHDSGQPPTITTTTAPQDAVATDVSDTPANLAIAVREPTSAVPEAPSEATREIRRQRAAALLGDTQPAATHEANAADQPGLWHRLGRGIFPGFH